MLRRFSHILIEKRSVYIDSTWGPSQMVDTEKPLATIRRRVGWDLVSEQVPVHEELSQPAVRDATHALP